MRFFKHHNLAAWGKEALYICAMKLDSVTHLINSRNRLRLCQSALTEAELRVRVSEKNNFRSSAQIPHQQEQVKEQVKWQQQSSCKRDNKHQLHRAVWRCLRSTREAALIHLTNGRTGGERNLLTSQSWLTPRPPLMNMPNNRKIVLLNSGQPTVQLGPKNFYSG